MNSTRRLHRSSTGWLFDSQLAPYVDAFKHRMAEGRYASHTASAYVACIAHFAHWSTLCQLDIRRLDEAVVQEFLDGHLPRCDCAWPVHRVRSDLRAALGHLLVVLRANTARGTPNAQVAISRRGNWTSWCLSGLRIGPLLPSGCS